MFGLISVFLVLLFHYLRFRRKESESDLEYHDRITKRKAFDLKCEKVFYAILAVLFVVGMTARGRTT